MFLQRTLSLLPMAEMELSEFSRVASLRLLEKYRLVPMLTTSASIQKRLRYLWGMAPEHWLLSTLQLGARSRTFRCQCILRASRSAHAGGDSSSIFPMFNP